MEQTNFVFIPEVWNVGLEDQLRNDLIFQNWTNREHEGAVSKAGDQVRIMTAGDVEIKRLDYSNDEDRYKFENELGKPQGMTGSGVTLVVNQIAYYQIQASDLNQKLSKENLYKEYQANASEQMAATIDSYIASFADKFPMYSKDPVKITVNNVTKVLSAMSTKLRKANVKGEVKMEVPFEFKDVLVEAYEKAQADNERYMKTGKITSDADSAVYHQMIFECSNNVLQDKDGNYYSALRTKDALAFVYRCSFSETKRADNGFSDIVRGYALFDAKVLFPKKGLCLKYTVDTAEEKYIRTKATA